MTTKPPEGVIEAARRAGEAGPCAKSKRGVVVFDPDAEHPRDVIIARGFNSPPEGFACTGTEACRKHCAKVCMHAEQRAILIGLDERARGPHNGVSGLDLLHVKVVEGVAVAGKPPCCLECSRLVVEVKLRGVWLFESTDMGGNDGCTCGARARTVTGDVVCHEPACPLMLKFSEWCFYEAERFHRQTLINTGAGMLADVRP